MNRFTVLFSAVFFSSITSFADVRLYCNASVEECVDKTTYGLMDMGCRLDSVTCEEITTLKNETKVRCAAITENCNEPSAELFGFTSKATKCYGAEKKNMRFVDRDLTLTWTMGLFRGYVRDICVSE